MGDHDINRSLIRAVCEGRLETLREIISSFGLSYSPGWSEGYVLLCDAVNNRHTEVVKLLLTYGSKVNSKNKIPADSPLHVATRNGDIQIVEMLLNRGAKINAKNYYGFTPLHNAITYNKMEMTELLLNQGADVNATDSNGISPVHLAIKYCSEEIINLFLSSVVNVNAEDKDGRTYIHIAAERGCLKIVNHLLKHGAYVNSVDASTFWEGYTPLCLAVIKGHEKMVQLLLEHGANVYAQDKNGKTILLFAVEKGHEKIVKLLLECGVDAEDKNGKTVLHSAVEKGHSVIIEHVLKYCPDVNNKGNRSILNTAVHGYGKECGMIIEKLLQYGFTVTPEDANNYELLHAAVEKGYLKNIEEHLKYGVDVNTLYQNRRGVGYMPLHVATINQQNEVAKLLISYRADVNAQDTTGKTPIFYAAENAVLGIAKLRLTNQSIVQDNPEVLNIAVKKEFKEIVEILLQHGADVNISDKCGRTALHFTASGNDQGFIGSHFFKDDDDSNVRGEIAKLLLSRGANVNAVTEIGRTTLCFAAEQGYVEVIEALLEYNADVNCTTKTDMTPLHIAAENGHLECVEVLLKFGASIDCKDKYGRTPLHIAAQYGHLETVEFFLKFGASVDSKDKRGRTALHIASQKGDKQTVTALLELGSDINIMSNDNCTALDFARVGIHFEMMDDDDPGLGIDIFEITTEILEHHMLKMKTANLYLSEKNLLSVSNFSNFQKECEEEIAIMKSETVGNTKVTFYDILTKAVSQVAMYAGNESIVQILRSDDYTIKFPIYASMINSNFRKGERRKQLVEQGNKILHFLFNNFPQLPHDCTEKIFSYLSDEDLRIVIDACKESFYDQKETPSCVKMKIVRRKSC